MGCRLCLDFLGFMMRILIWWFRLFRILLVCLWFIDFELLCLRFFWVLGLFVLLVFVCVLTCLYFWFLWFPEFLVSVLMDFLVRVPFWVWVLVVLCLQFHWCLLTCVCGFCWWRNAVLSGFGDFRCPCLLMGLFALTFRFGWLDYIW